MEKKPNLPEANEIKIDPDVKKLAVFFRILNADRPIITSKFGEIAETVLLASILLGTRTGEIKFDWFKTKKGIIVPPEVKIFEAEKRQVLITFDRRHFDQIETALNNVGVFPGVFGYENTNRKLNKLNKENNWPIPGWPEIYSAITDAYSLYRQV